MHPPMTPVATFSSTEEEPTRRSPETRHATDGTATDGTATDGTATDGTATDGMATRSRARVVVTDEKRCNNLGDRPAVRSHGRLHARPTGPMHASHIRSKRLPATMAPPTARTRKAARPPKGCNAKRKWALEDALNGHSISIVPSRNSGKPAIGTVVGRIADRESGGLHLLELESGAHQYFDLTLVEDWALVDVHARGQDPRKEAAAKLPRTNEHSNEPLDGAFPTHFVLPAAIAEPDERSMNPFL